MSDFQQIVNGRPVGTPIAHGDLPTLTLTLDVTGTGSNGTIPTTLATVNPDVGSFGSSTAIPSFTVNGKGLITAASTSAVIAPASTLTGTTLAASITGSSLTSVGTIISGVWNGTALTSSYLPASIFYTDISTTLSADLDMGGNDINNIIAINGSSSGRFVLSPGTGQDIAIRTLPSSPTGFTLMDQGENWGLQFDGQGISIDVTELLDLICEGAPINITTDTEGAPGTGDINLNADDGDGTVNVIGNITASSTGAQYVLGTTADPGSAKTTLTIQGSTTGYANAAGLFIKAGTASSNYAAIIANAANSSNLLVVGGTGAVTTKNNTLDDASGNATFTGTLTLPNNTAFQFKDSGGTARRIGLVAADNQVYYGAIDSGWAASNTNITAGNSLIVRTNSASSATTALTINNTQDSTFVGYIYSTSTAQSTTPTSNAISTTGGIGANKTITTQGDLNIGGANGTDTKAAQIYNTAATTNIAATNGSTGTVTLAGGNTNGMLIVTDQQTGHVGVFLLTLSGSTIAEVSDPASVYSPTAPVAASGFIHVQFSAGVLTYTNETGLSLIMSTMFLKIS